MEGGAPGLIASLRGLLRAPVPRDYRGWSRIGWLLLLLFGLQLLSGTLLTFYYQPSPGEAARSTAYIMREVSWGWLVRGLHHWSTHLLIGLSLLQLARVVVQRSWRGPRAGSWVIGLLLLALTLALAWSGRLLVWDLEAWWSVQLALERLEGVPWVGAWLAPLVRGGETLGATTLGRLFSLHALLLPGVFTLLVALNLWHLARTRRARGPR